MDRALIPIRMEPSIKGIWYCGQYHGVRIQYINKNKSHFTNKKLVF